MAVDSDFALRSERMIQHDRAAVAIAGFPVERFAGWNRLARRVDDVRLRGHRPSGADSFPGSAALLHRRIDGRQR